MEKKKPEVFYVKQEVFRACLHCGELVSLKVSETILTGGRHSFLKPFHPACVPLYKAEHSEVVDIRDINKELSMETRKATPTDRPGIKRLIEANPDTLMQTHLPKSREFFVTLDNNKIVGCCALAVYSKRLAEVRSLAVDSEFRGAGIALKLVQACLEEAKERKIYEIIAITGAVELFEKGGFGAFQKEKFAMIKILGE